MNQTVCGVQFILTLSNLQSFRGSSFAILSHCDSNRRRFTSSLDCPIMYVMLLSGSTVSTIPVSTSQDYIAFDVLHGPTSTWLTWPSTLKAQEHRTCTTENHSVPSGGEDWNFVSCIQTLRAEAHQGNWKPQCTAISENCYQPWTTVHSDPWFADGVISDQWCEENTLVGSLGSLGMFCFALHMERACVQVYVWMCYRPRDPIGPHSHFTYFWLYSLTMWVCRGISGCHWAWKWIFEHRTDNFLGDCEVQ
jgi:hypothetical protein